MRKPAIRRSPIVADKADDTMVDMSVSPSVLLNSRGVRPLGGKAAGLLTCGSLAGLRPSRAHKAQWHVAGASPLTVAGAVTGLAPDG
jgi:hypothetical protein